MNRGNTRDDRQFIPPVTDTLPIAVRTYGIPEAKKAGKEASAVRGPSKWVLVFDTETSTDEKQTLRIGTYQLRYGDEQREQGLFFNPATVTPTERRTLKEYAITKRLKLITFKEFIDKIFVRVAYHWQATTIGFNLPFDLARLAEGHTEARGKMRPGFSLETTSKDKKGPRVRIKHITRASLMEFSGPGQRLPRGQTRRKVVAPLRRPAFVDVATLAHALLSRIFSLKDLAKFLETPHQKLDTDEHGRTLTPEYLDYAVQDVQVTWECFVELRKRFDEHGLSRTPIYRIYSEAGIGRGYLREMGIRSWREMQPNFPPTLIGKIMSTYYGGRTEVHLRRIVTQVLYCDFTSMYPTVSTLMGLWPYVIGQAVSWRDATVDTHEFVNRVTLADLQRRDTWRRFHVIVQIEPDGDILPVRAKYEYQPIIGDERRTHYTIGLNYLTLDRTLWYALPDVIASKLLTERTPKILKAIMFEPGKPQNGLRPVAIAGKVDFHVDPLKDDFFKRLIELRMLSEGQDKTNLKLVANSMGYGIFVQLNVQERAEPVAVRCYPATGRQFLVDMDKVEQPGEFFHPMLGTFITSAARLMLAMTERLIFDAGLDWTFCDTDSMAIAKPADMDEPEFFRKAQAVRNWFAPLNPYDAQIDLFKLEDANFRLENGKATKDLQPLFCFAISSKRYVMFNIDARGEPVIRKATAHGLGHLLPPYSAEAAQPVLLEPIFTAAKVVEKIGVNRWQHDFWLCITRAAVAETPNRFDFSKLTNFDQPAATQYAATSPNLLGWFDHYNRNKPYSEQVRPFNFLLMYQAHQGANWNEWRSANGLGAENAGRELPRVIAPYDSDRTKAAKHCFDRDTGAPVPPKMLKSYLQSLAQYPLHPEAKFLNADYRDTGTTQRRHVKVELVVYVGKEANRWEEQSYLGVDPAAEIEYGMTPQDRKRAMGELREMADKFGQRALAEEAAVSLQHLSAILLGTAEPGEKILAKIKRASETLHRAHLEYEVRVRDVMATVRIKAKEIGLREFSVRLGIDAGNLASVLNGRRKASQSVLKRLAREI